MQGSVAALCSRPVLCSVAAGGSGAELCSRAAVGRSAVPDAGDTWGDTEAGLDDSVAAAHGAVPGRSPRTGLRPVWRRVTGLRQRHCGRDGPRIGQ